MGRQVWTPSLVLEGIRNLQESGKAISHGCVARDHPRLLYAAERYFGNWGAALAAAGADLARVQSTSKANRAEKIAKWSADMIIEQIRRLASSGERMTASAVRLKYPALYHTAVSKRYFGKWERALSAASVETKPAPTQKKGKDPWRSQLLLDRLAELKKQYGDLPEELARQLFPEMVEAVAQRFGDWNRAAELADDSADGEPAMQI